MSRANQTNSSNHYHQNKSSTLILTNSIDNDNITEIISDPTENLFSKPKIYGWHEQNNNDHLMLNSYKGSPFKDYNFSFSRASPNEPQYNDSLHTNKSEGVCLDTHGIIKKEQSKTENQLLKNSKAKFLKDFIRCQYILIFEIRKNKN